MKNLLPLLCVFGVCTGGASAGSVFVTDALTSSDTGNIHYSNETSLYVPLRDATGASIGNGAAVRVGFFTGYTTELDARLRTAEVFDFFSADSEHKFVALGEGTSGDGLGGDNKANLQTKTLAGTDGRVVTNMSGVNYLTGTPNAAATGGLNSGTKLFVFLFNQAVPTLSPGTQWGLYSASSWIVADSNAVTTRVDLKDVDTAGEVYHGSLGSLRTAPVPEAGTFTLALAGSLLTLRRRR